MSTTDKIAALVEKQKRISERMKKLKKLQTESQRERFFRLAAEAGILNIRDEALLVAEFKRIVQENSNG